VRSAVTASIRDAVLGLLLLALVVPVLSPAQTAGNTPQDNVPASERPARNTGSHSARPVPSTDTGELPVAHTRRNGGPPPVASLSEGGDDVAMVQRSDHGE
jgi:hypothetical protein